MEGFVKRVVPSGVTVQLLPDGPSGLLPLSNISRARLTSEQLDGLFTPGDKLKVS